eukprot:2251946-Prymnesium_polylepis.1
MNIRAQTKVPEVHRRRSLPKLHDFCVNRGVARADQPNLARCRLVVKHQRCRLGQRVNSGGEFNHDGQPRS